MKIEIDLGDFVEKMLPRAVKTYGFTPQKYSWCLQAERIKGEKGKFVLILSSDDNPTNTN